MDRLTYKLDEEYKSTYLHYKYMRIADYDIKRNNLGRITDAMIYNKLGEIEDFMEQNEWDSLEEMKETLDKCEKKYFEINQENQSLKDRWQKLKEYIKTNNEVLLYSIEDKPAKLGNKKYNYFERKQLLDKMQELEKE